MYSSHLGGMGSWARYAIAAARALAQLMPTQLAVAGPLSPQVADWAAGLELVPYDREATRGAELLLNVDAFSYAEPLAQRNIAWVFAPHHNNVPPPEFELYAVSEYVQAVAEKTWQRMCGRLYPPVTWQPNEAEKERLILHVARFVPPSELIDPGHRVAIEQFGKLTLELEESRWQLALIGGLVPGAGGYLDALQQATAGSNIRLLANADQGTLQTYLSMATFVWDTAGFEADGSPLSRRLFPATVLEGSAAGAVPIAGDHGANREVITHGYNGLLVEEPDQYAELTKQLIQMPSAWAMLSQRAYIGTRGWISETTFLERVEAMLGKRQVPRPPVPRWLDTAPGQDEVTAIVVFHNQIEATTQCLEMLTQLNPSVRVVLVDNRSSEDPAALRQHVEDRGGVYLRRESNDGLGPAWHEAAAVCDRPFVLLLHNDCCPVLSGDWLDVLLAELQDDDQVAIVGAKLIRPDGKTIQFAGWGYRPEHGGVFSYRGDGEPDAPCYNIRGEAVAVSSAAMLCRREHFAPDPTYQLVFGDFDLCLKAREAGHKVVYQPAAFLVHAEGTTRRSRPDVEAVVQADRRHFLASYPQFAPEPPPPATASR